MPGGGSYLITPTDPASVFTPEDFSEEDRMVAGMVADFVNNEVVPVTDDVEAQKEGLMKSLLEKAGELGLLSADIPEEYGGGGMSKIVTTIITENISMAGSFAVAHGAHTGIGTLPIVFFGNEEQKKRYLPDLATGKKLAAYALTEPGAGSDALAARTRAVLSPDGRHYLLTGEKMFITNGGTADVFVTYAKIDGDKFTAFIVDRDTPGFSTGAEEHKMGIKGSSTRSLVFEEAPVPVENLLHEPGRGHVVAFNILNIGRFKLAAGAMGSCKAALGVAARYAQTREQFKTPIIRFGLIREKLAQMAARTYAAESMVYRTAGLIEEGLAGKKGATGAEVAAAIEEYAVECSINKVFASEALDYVVDEAVQIHGGYGYIGEYGVERAYRDARINRIFEGTNEVNRLLIPGTLLRRAAKGQLGLLAAAQALTRDIFDLGAGPGEGLLAEEARMVEMARKMFLLAGGAAAQKYLDKIAHQQEVLGVLADMAMEVFAMDSAVARALKASDFKASLARAYVHTAFPRLELMGRKVLAHLAEGDELRTQLSVLKRLGRYEPCDLIALNGEIADRVSEAGGYVV